MSNPDTEIPIPDGVEVEYDIVYGTGGGRDLQADLFRPVDDSTGRGGLVFVHGGGWTGGTRRQFWRHAARMASLGFVGLCVEHRLSGEATFPAAVEDVNCAVRYMRSQARELRVDPDRLGSVGGSSGGHLAAMLATTDAADGMEGDGGFSEFDSRVNASVCFNPVLDLRAMLSQTGMSEDGPIPRFIGGMPETHPEQYDSVSPFNHVDDKTAPTLMLHGTADTTVPIDQSETFLKRLEEVGVWGELAAYAGAKHGFFNGDPWFAPTLARMEEFLERMI